MQESPFFQEYIKEAREEAREIGQRETTIELTLTILNDKFQPEAVRELIPVLERIESIEQLKKLGVAASKSPTLDAFRATLNEDV